MILLLTLVAFMAWALAHQRRTAGYWQDEQEAGWASQLPTMETSPFREWASAVRNETFLEHAKRTGHQVRIDGGVPVCEHGDFDSPLRQLLTRR